MNQIGSDSKADREELHLGYRDADKEQPPLLIDFQKLRHHGAILAGSGAGKSTLIGRIVEEILLKTEARVVIIDTNGDFRKAHIVVGSDEEGAVWKAQVPPQGETYHKRELFEERWRRLTKIHLTHAHNTEPTIGVEWSKPFLSWNKLPMQWQMDILKLELSHDPDEVAALYRVTQRLGGRTALKGPISPQTVRSELEAMTTTSTIINPAGEGRIDMKLQNRFQQVAELNIWRQEVDDVDLSYWFQGRKHKSRRQLSIFDVPSISNSTSRNILVAFLLELLWGVAQKDWEDAVDHPDSDTRVPTFLVVDEAHNFVPTEDPMDPHALRISQSIQRIAAEGRKYGLFLLLATQRPSKVRPGLLSECENICLLRLRSPIERGLAVDTWALGKDHIKPNPPLANFEQGQGLLCGSWADWNEIPFRGGGRRTKATGGNLPPDWIHKRAT